MHSKPVTLGWSDVSLGKCDVSLIPAPTWWKESATSYRLSSDLHTHKHHGQRMVSLVLLLFLKLSLPISVSNITCHCPQKTSPGSLCSTRSRPCLSAPYPTFPLTLLQFLQKSPPVVEEVAGELMRSPVFWGRSSTKSLQDSERRAR